MNYLELTGVFTVLRSYAQNPESSRGRIINVAPSMSRSPFQRDRDRIIHSAAFRRLQHKTQVFLHHEGQHFRTRLTHTLEVSQIARSISRALGLNEDLAEAVALAHDLGHTPFGHAGERALNQSMQPYGGFDHNIQALRTVMLLENRYIAHDGLNLTLESLDGILKHNGPLSEKEQSFLDLIPNWLGRDANSFASLEAQVAAISDDIAYNAHDIDDAIRANLISLEKLKSVPLVGPIVEQVQSEYPDAAPHRQSHETQRRLITGLVDDVIKTSEDNLQQFNIQSPQDVYAAPQTIIAQSEAAANELTLLQTFMFSNVYRAPVVSKPVAQSERLLQNLFDHYFEHDDLPQKWSEELAKAHSDEDRARIIADFIAGMTDPFATNEFSRLFDEKIDFS